MDTASNLPFVLKINNSNTMSFSLDEKDIYADDFDGVNVYENDEIEVVFQSQDLSARLYLEALDILPEQNGVMLDEEGRVYRQVSSTPFYLYKHDDAYDALRVDSFRILILCNGQKYYTLFNVLPKQMDISEWNMMRNDLENEITGLAQDIVRKNIGLGGDIDGTIPPKKLYTFFVIKKYASSMLNALFFIQKSPKSHIITEYARCRDFEVKKIDSHTIKEYLIHGGRNDRYSVPLKKISYDIPENRLLKKIIAFYDRELYDFIQELLRIKAYREKKNSNKHLEYQKLYLQGITEFIETANRLQKITAIIKSQTWYKSISVDTSIIDIVTHSFVMDAHYSVLYKMYQELKSDEFHIKLDPLYAYSWKKSSSLYEMWCYIKICRALAHEYELENNQWTLNFGVDSLFPYLQNGAKMVFSDDVIQLEIIFDQFLPKSKNKIALHEQPFYSVGKHTRPDITIDVYEKKDDCYIGSIILECKYRKLNSFWNDQNKWCSKEQFKAYYTDVKSELMYNKGVDIIKPVSSVIVLTPDEKGQGVSKSEHATSVHVLKPSHDDSYMSALTGVLKEEVLNIIKTKEKILG